MATPDPAPPALRLGHVLGVLLLVAVATLALLFALLLSATRQAVLDASESVRIAATEQSHARVHGWLSDTLEALDDVEDQLRAGTLDPDDRDAVEAALFARVRANADLGEVTFTRADSNGFDADGEAIVLPDTHWQVSVVRVGDRIRTLETVHTGPAEGDWQRTERPWAEGTPLRSQPFTPVGSAGDPTKHLTFTVPASSFLADRITGRGRGLWTDLHWSELDAAAPEADRTVVVAVMKRAARPDGSLLGILRAALRADHLDELVAAQDPDDPHVIVLIDDKGRLVSRLSHEDRYGVEDDEALRAHPSAPPPEVVAAVSMTADEGRFSAGGRTWVYGTQPLEETRDWRIRVLVPEDAYTGELVAARDRALAAAVALIGAVLLVSFAALRMVRRGFAEIEASVGRVRRLDFAAAPVAAPLREVHDALDSLERSKTALRAMGRYVPMDLVRTLYEGNREPMLGGEPADVTLLFTDIVGFTTISERLAPNELAAVLGRYLATMTEEIARERGTIDKFIGDAVMALWNVPAPVADPQVHACRAALACVAAIERMHADPSWAGRPRMDTRFGLHHDRVLVGHFGAPERMSYTVLGDGVNLASRLEALNKAYGTTILVSEAVEAAARGQFSFRWLDVVAVKGKTRPVRVFELLGPPGADSAREAAAARYAEALGAYVAGRFPEAAAGFRALADPAAAVLLARCEALIASPPAAGWDGVYVATTK